MPLSHAHLKIHRKLTVAIWELINHNARLNHVVGDQLLHNNNNNNKMVELPGVSSPQDKTHVRKSTMTGQKVLVLIKLSMIKCINSLMSISTLKEKVESVLLLTVLLLVVPTIITG